MSSNFTVIYDACVLYPAPLCDLLMRLALADLYRVRWMDMIHDEWTRNVLKQRPALKAEDLDLPEIPAPRGVPATRAAGGHHPKHPKSATFSARAVSVLCLACG